MPEQEPILKDQDRTKLDGIVQQMVSNKESDENIQAVVNDFKKKYAVKPETSEPVKKKEETSTLAVSPSGSLEKTPPPAKQPAPSVSDGQFTETIFDSIFGNPVKETPKRDKNAFIGGPATSDVADETGSLLNTTETELSKGKDEQTKSKIHERVVNFRNNFFNGTLTPDDIKLLPGQSGMSDKDAAEAINNKTKNLKIWGNVSVMRGIAHADLDMKTITNRLDQLNKLGGDHSEEIKNLQDKRAFLSNSINQVYNAEADKTANELVGVLTPSLGKKKTVLGELEAPIQYDPYTNTIDEKSQFYIRKSVDDYLNAHPNDVVNYKTSGSTETGKRNYPDIANRVVSYFNTVIPVKRAQEQSASEIATKYPQAKGLISHIRQIEDYFSKEQIAKADSYIKSSQDKNFLGVNEKYFGQSGLLSTNHEFQSLQQKWKQVVQDKRMPENVAMDQLQEEAKKNPSLKKIIDNYNKEVDLVQTASKKMWEDYMVNGLKKIDPSLTMYKNGNVGIEGLNQEDSKKIIDEYNTGQVNAATRVLKDQHEKLGLRADRAAQRIGAFGTSFVGSINDLQGAFSKFWFDKTGWGGQAVQMYQAKRDANIQSDQSDEARKWNWQGFRSLGDPNFYKSAIGSQLPLFGGIAAVTAATKGAGLPEAISWLSVAGLFDGSMAIQTYNDILLNGTDKFGNRLTEHDAAKAAADNFNKNMVPDILFAAANVGILSRAKNISKPTLLKTLGTATKGLAIGTIPMTWQGYNQYATKLESEGKTPDIWDYAQDGKFAHSLIEGVVGGAFLQLLHTPMDHIRSTENWKRMIYTGPAEFNSNAMFNVLLGHEISGRGNQFRDALKMKIATEEMPAQEKEDAKNNLLYSVSLEKNIKGGGIDVSNVNGAYQAHTLALADLHDEWAKQNEGNPNLAKIYSEQAGEFRKQAKAVMEGKGKYKFLTDHQDRPIFISDNSFKVLDADGKIAEWIKTGTIEGVHSSTEPGFDADYKEKIKASKGPEPESVPVKEPTVENDDQSIVINALKDHAGDLSGTFKMTVEGAIGDPKNYEELTKEIVSQAIDHPTLAKEMLGNEAWKKIEPIVNKARKEAESLAETERVKSVRSATQEPILKQEIEGIDLKRKARAEMDFEGKKMRTDAVIDKLKERHNTLEDIIKNCL
jgi:hypothetical protein